MKPLLEAIVADIESQKLGGSGDMALLADGALNKAQSIMSLLRSE